MHPAENSQSPNNSRSLLSSTMSRNTLDNVSGVARTQIPELRPTNPTQSLGSGTAIEYNDNTTSSSRLLEVCINKIGNKLVLEEFDVSALNDGQVFQEIGKRYHRIRQKQLDYRLKLFKPGAVHYVKVCQPPLCLGTLYN